MLLLLLLLQLKHLQCLPSHSLDKQSSKSAADVCKAHQLVVLLLAARCGGLAWLTAALWVVR
jgi:hypothetical protein